MVENTRQVGYDGVVAKFSKEWRGQLRFRGLSWLPIGDGVEERSELRLLT
jgi:hypothetical protein